MAKNVLLQMKINDVVEQILPRTIADLVMVADNETLSQRLEAIGGGIDGLITPAQVDAKIAEAVKDMATNAAVSQAVSNAVNALIDGAPGTYDTLKEIADYIAQDGEAAAAMTELIATKVDKVEGMGLSANDFTDALLAKLNAISEGANKVEASETNGNIKVDGAEVTVYTHPAVNHIPEGGAAGQHLAWNAAGEAKWEDMPEYILSGSEAPADLEEGQLFVQLL